MQKTIASSLGIASIALLTSISAQADFTMTFDSGPLSTEWSGAAVWSAGPAGWAGGGSLQTTYAASGWTGWSPTVNFDWASGHQPDMQAIAASGNGHLSFDIMVDGSSFTPGVSDWYNASMAGNSDGGGWTQIDNIMGAGPWHNAGDNALYVTHVDETFAQMGWTTASTWFQINFAGNSGASPLHYYIDNLAVTTVPEPSTLALAGLGALGGLMLFRRRLA